MLHGLHEGWEIGEAGRLGNCCAAACLSCGSATDGLRPIPEILELGTEFPERSAPVADRSRPAPAQPSSWKKT